MKCLIPGCQNEAKHRICDEHWYKLPIKLRERWWLETDYAKKDPTPELLADMKAAYEQKQSANTADGGPASIG